MAEVDPVKLAAAKQAARLFLTQMLGTPTDVQLMALEMLASTIFQTGVKPERMHQMLKLWLKSVSDTVLDVPRKEKKGKKRG